MMYKKSQKNIEIDGLVYFLIVLCFGYLGVHYFIRKNTKMGLLYLFTMGLFMIGWIVDIAKAAANIDFKKFTVPKPQTQNQVVIPTQQVQINNSLQQELARVDAMSIDGFQFEQYCADLLIKNGFSTAKVTHGSGDFGIDILAEKDNISYAIQCKCYSNTVGNKAVQEAFSGKEFYKCMVAAVLTNSTFTQSAKETANQTRVLLWDRQFISDMISNVLPKSEVEEETNIT